MEVMKFADGGSWWQDFGKSWPECVITNHGKYYIAGAASLRSPLVTGLWAVQETEQET